MRYTGIMCTKPRQKNKRMCMDLNAATVTITITAILTAMTMDRMTTDTPGLLQLIWLASPALPIGGFSYSEGLESAIEHGWVHDETSVADWLADQLHLSQARGDLSVVAQALTLGPMYDAPS